MPMKAPNVQLREWRNTERLTRLEMADRINATATGIAESLACDEERVRRWETGDVRWPSTVYRLALTQLTGQTPEDLGFWRTQRDERMPAPVATADTSAPSAGNGRLLVGQDAAVDEAELRLATDQHITAALDWLDRQAGWQPGSSRRKVASHLVGLDPRKLRDEAQLRGRITRDQVAAALRTYYFSQGNAADHNTYRIRSGKDVIATSLLTKPQWLDLRLALGSGNDDFRLTDSTSPDLLMDPLRSDAAIVCLAEALITGRRMVNAPLYRMIDLDIEAKQIRSTFGIEEFIHYALSMDLLERELLDAIAEGRPTHAGTLPLRDRYLPDIETVVNPAGRLCAGGPLALFAVARPATRSRRGSADYIILVQERSGNVLNAAQKLAVIPKAFHEPLADYGEDVSVLCTLEREMEEELFGRDDVDSTFGEQLHADPMHPSRLSAPMAWLAENPSHWQMECTGYGFNLVSGNYEFASLIVVNDEEWWTKFGGHITANWESSGLRRYSTLDKDLITSLVHDPAWSNEGLFALSEGIRRLSEIGGDRVNLPTLEVEI
ncbi:hypothetical protein [Streptosporangium sp. KLBMP 9127]|nr:hypothetical protein [Streptosporangium sp. KLBMP 9127]